VVWLPRVAAVTLLGAAGVVAGKYLLKATSTPAMRTRAPEPLQGAPPAARRKTTGGLHVTSNPAGAQVLVDGKARGVTPLTLTDLTAGRHAIELRSDAGAVRRTVTVDADQTAEIDESIFSGWLAVYSPFELVVSEGGRALRLDDRNQIMLAPGRHELRLANRALAYEAVHQVELKPGEMTTLRVTPPPSAMTITATEAAEVWLDGARVGETPLNAVPVQLGTHDLVVRRTTGGERRFTITITVNPFTLNVDFSKP
jgi:archaellum component FlaG (FlaF/FlaG flagellin family)